MNGREPTAADKLEALTQQYETLKAAYITLEAEVARLREALTLIAEQADVCADCCNGPAIALAALDMPAREGGEG